MRQKFFEPVAILVGTIVGAGILGIPYVVAQVGLPIGLAYILGTGLVFLLLNLMMGELVARTKRPAQLIGLSKKYLGPWGGRLSILVLFLGAYSASLAYIIGEGQVLAALLGGTPFFWSIIFFTIGALILTRQTKSIATFEFFFTLVVFTIVILIATTSVPHLRLENFVAVDWSQLFLPFGVMLFAYGGATAIPQMEELLPGQPRRLHRAIVIGSLIPIALYAVFALVIVGVTGLSTTEIATVGLGQTVGPWMLIVGNLFAFFTMSTSFLMNGTIMKRTFEWDWGLGRVWAWVLALFPPLVIFLIGARSFIAVLSAAGAIVGGLLAILIITAFWRAKKLGDIQSGAFNLTHSRSLGTVMILLFIIGSLYTIFSLFG